MKTIEALNAYLTDTLPQAHIYLFGSRARESASPYSDVDIAIESDTLDARELALIRFHIEESNFPFKVDLVDLAKAPYLKEIVHKEGIRW